MNAPTAHHAGETTTEHHELTSAHCANCERFIGPVAVCPYCGAKHKGHIPLKWLKLGAVFFAIVGLALIWLWAQATDVPQVRIGDISATMNLAYARVQGTILRDVNYDPESQYLSFWVEDDSGEIYVSCYEDITSELLTAGNLPELGDTVDIAGTLRVREDFLSMTLNAVEHVSFTHPDAKTKLSSQLTVLDEGKRVKINGIIDGIRQPYDGLTLIDIYDSEGEITLTVGETITQLSGTLPDILPGYSITAEGTVTLYKGTPQLSLTNSADLQTAPVEKVTDTPSEDNPSTTSPTEQTPVPTPQKTPVPLQDISADDLTKTVHTTGHIAMLEGINGGVKALLDNGVAEVPLVLWMDTYDALPNRFDFDEGAEIEVRAKVSVYEGEVELIAQDAKYITIITPAPPPDWVAVNDLSEADVGRRVRIRGITEGPDGFSAGVKIPLNDGSGTITVLLWANIYDAIPGKISADTPVEITGIIQSYRGELELIPRTQYDWARIED